MIANSGDQNLPAYNYIEPMSPNSMGLQDPMLQALIETRAFQRLKEIRFLGGIDYLMVPVPNGAAVRYTRYQHSLGVTRLALLYADVAGLNIAERRLACAAALLHDVGHAPLSHSLEPVFFEEFGVDHHRATRDVITGRSVIGQDILNVLKSYDVDVEAVMGLISGEKNTFDAFFSGPINFDTIEGILRCQSYTRQRTLPSPDAITYAAIHRNSYQERSLVDTFWNYKDQVYRTVINSQPGVLADYVCQSFMRQNIERFSADDYFLTERQVFRKLPGLLEFLKHRSFLTLIFRKIDHPVSYRARRFFVDTVCDFFARNDECRYRQQREQKTLLPLPLTQLHTEWRKSDLFDDSRQ